MSSTFQLGVKTVNVAFALRYPPDPRNNRNKGLVGFKKALLLRETNG